MKINGPNSVGAVNQYKKSQESGQGISSSKKGKMRDQVEISSEAKELLGTQGTQASESAQEKIDALKKSVQAGTYHVDVRKLADKLFPFLK